MFLTGRPSDRDFPEQLSGVCAERCGDLEGGRKKQKTRLSAQTSCRSSDSPATAAVANVKRPLVPGILARSVDVQAAALHHSHHFFSTFTLRLQHRSSVRIKKKNSERTNDASPALRKLSELSIQSDCAVRDGLRPIA